jgi:protein-disulfide isomerase
MNNGKILKISLVVVLGFGLYFYSQSVKLSKQVLKLEAVCGDKCKDVMVELPVKNLDAIAEGLSLDKNQLKECLDTSKYASKVNASFDEARKLNVGGTPGNFIYNKNTGLGVFASGAYPYEILVTALKKLREPSLKENDIVYENADMQVKLIAKKFPDLPAVTDKDHTQGSKDAEMVLVEYSDLECPFCAKFHPIATELSKVDGVLWVFRHFPLRQAHPDAQKMAEATECAVDQKGEEGFWSVTEAFYSMNEEAKQ